LLDPNISDWRRQWKEPGAIVQTFRSIRIASPPASLCTYDLPRTGTTFGPSASGQPPRVPSRNTRPAPKMDESSIPRRCPSSSATKRRTVSAFRPIDSPAASPLSLSTSITSAESFFPSGITHPRGQYPCPFSRSPPVTTPGEPLPGWAPPAASIRSRAPAPPARGSQRPQSHPAGRPNRPPAVNTPFLQIFRTNPTEPFGS